MRSSLLLGLACLTLGVMTAGCGKKTCNPMMYADGTGAGTNPTTTNAATTVLEADVVELDEQQNRIYAMSRSGTLSIVDASTPGALGLMGSTTLSGIPFEMYRQGDILLAMSTSSVNTDGTAIAAPSTAPVAGASSMLVAVDVSAPASPQIVAWAPVAGEIVDSRIVGHILYLATYQDGTCYACATDPKTVVASYDISSPTTPFLVDRAEYLAPTDTQAWLVTPWKHPIFATDQRIYVGGGASTSVASANEGEIDVIDISDPTGKLRKAASILVAGPIASRWQMDETNGILRVVSEAGTGYTTDGTSPPEVDTFRVDSSDSLTPLGHVTLSMPQEALKSVRFDGTRAYVVTAMQSDPLVTIDLSNPALPVQGGNIQIPGWIFHLEPKGNQLLGLGLDSTNPNGSLSLSLFDVSSVQQPELLQRQLFGQIGMYGDLALTDTVLAEDQDRMDKAFRIFDDGLIAIPYSSANGTTSLCSGGGVQLFQLADGAITKEALLPMSGNARRAIRQEGGASQELIGVSDSNVSAFDITQRATVKATADVVIGTCTTRTITTQVATPVGTGYDDVGGDNICE